MKYQIEFRQNPNCCTIHIQKRVANHLETFYDPNDKIDVHEGGVFVGCKEVPVFVKRIWEVDGVTRITIDNYQVTVHKAPTFEWEAILERVILTLNLELFPKEEPALVVAPKKSQEEIIQELRKRGLDVQ